MNYWSLVITILFFISTGFCMFMLSRNKRTVHYRQSNNNKIYRASIYDRLFNRDPEWRREVEATVSYQQMFRKFWKPLESFYPDKSFVEIDGDYNEAVESRVKELLLLGLGKPKGAKTNKNTAVSKAEAENLDLAVKEAIMIMRTYVSADLHAGK